MLIGRMHFHKWRRQELNIDSKGASSSPIPMHLPATATVVALPPSLFASRISLNKYPIYLSVTLSLSEGPRACLFIWSRGLS